MSDELLQACRGSVKHHLMRYEQMILSCNYVETKAIYVAEANRLRALLDAIDAQPPASSERVANGLPFGIIDPDYARVFTQARIIAWQYGYACVMHGSFSRDLDLLLVPWEERARPNHDQLLKLIAQASGLRFRDGEDILNATVDWSEKPHSRKACSLFFPAEHDRRWVDISVMPTVAAPAPRPDEATGQINEPASAMPAPGAMEGGM